MGGDAELSYSEEMTFETILASMLDRVPDIVDKREGSVIYDALAPAAAELAKAYIELDVIMDETFVDTASLQYLMKRCKERGVTIKDATAAVVEGTFTPSELELDMGLRFNCNDQNFAIIEKISDGKYQLQCEETGTAGNIYSGMLLPIQYVEGLQSAYISAVLVPGEDADDADTLRQRYYDNIDSLAFGGNIADYKQRAELLDGVGGVKIEPVWNGGGTVKLVIIDSDYGVPSEELIRQVQTAVDPEQNHGEGLGIAPIGHVVTVEGVTAFEIAVTANITFTAGWSYKSAKDQLKAAVDEYFLSLAQEWANEEATVVRISQIENKLINLSCVLDISGTALNGSEKNIQLADDEIPKCSGVSVTGAAALARSRESRAGI